MKVDRMQPRTVAEALRLARTYWEAQGPSSRMMATRAETCALSLGKERELDSLGPADATLVLTDLRKSSLAVSSQAAYYAAFLRALKMSGVSTQGWPSPPSPPRSVRDPIKEADLDGLHAFFLASGWPDTADLLTVLRGTGMRVDVEALDWDAVKVDAKAGKLRIKGKGGHEREVPVNSAVLTILGTKERASAMRRRPYSTHLWRWRKGVSHLGVTSRLPTPHAVRHLYATQAYRRSGRNLKAVMLLLGHADISTTERYIGVDAEELREAAGA